MTHLSTVTTTGLKRPATNYSHCPLKKRPIKYDFEDNSSSDSDNLQNNGKNLNFL